MKAVCKRTRLGWAPVRRGSATRPHLELRSSNERAERGPRFDPGCHEIQRVSSRRWIRVLTVDCVTCNRCDAATKLPVATTTRNVRASSVSIGVADI